MTWAFRRQIFYVSVFIALFAGFAFLTLSPRFNKAPSCMDGKQNGAETGVDCGGACERACISQVDELSVLWARSFRVIPGRYNAVAYLENHNKNVAVNKISYRFRFADANNVYIGKREGSTFIPPSGKIAVFEPAINIGNSIPVYTTFEFTQMPEWVQVVEERINQSQIIFSKVLLANETTSPKLFLSVKNDSLSVVKDLNIVAILYDNNHNAISASRTFMERLLEEEEKEASFTWPEPFSSVVVVKEIIPMYNFWSSK